ncbi:uncharacterized protein METZ01_LOCUS134978 [marine metagenome]|uniref:Uncharacterized protein n=1 Tax=marine metagenome TaxID=408172 RepID=A0A381YYV5_9ZZZZ
MGSIQKQQEMVTSDESLNEMLLARRLVGP